MPDLKNMSQRAQIILQEFLYLKPAEKKAVLEELNKDYGFLISSKETPLDEDLSNKQNTETTTT
jgi:hypothetical protein